MKIEVNLEDIFRDDDGNPEESIEECIHRQITDRLTGDLRKRLFDRIDNELGKAMAKMVEKVVAEKGDSIINNILEAKYTPVSDFGQRGSETTFRDSIVKAVSSQIVYKPANYSSDENAFTRAVKSIVENQTDAVKAAITAQVDTKFKEDAIKFAVSELSKRLGLSK